MTDIINGDFGCAWRHAFVAQTPAQAATLEAWIVHAPYAHPAWSQYVLCLIHLRDIPGVEPPARYGEGGTHEIVVIALNPKHLRQPEDEAKQLPLHYLTPPNFFGQFAAESDAAAIETLRATVQLVVSGRLSPDTDFRREWMRRFPLNPYGQAPAPLAHA